MGWWMAIPAAVGAVTSLMGNEEGRKQNQTQMMVEAGRVRESPYINTPSVDVRQKPRMNSFMQGALAGAQFGKLNENLWDDDKSIASDTQEDIAMNMMNQQRQLQMQQQFNPMQIDPMQNQYNPYA